MSKPIGLKVNTPELMKQRSFVQTVRTGGITSAAKLLGLTPSAVSKNIARLEAELGMQLLARDNRHLTPTQRGQEAYAAYADLLAQLDRVQQQLTAPSELGGQLALSIPSGTLPWLTPLLDAYRDACPEVQLHLNISDDYSDLVRDRNDFALRLGSLKDSNLRALALPATPLVICASPAYLARAGTPLQPADLGTHEGLWFRRPGSGRVRQLALPADMPGWQARAVLDDGQALAHAALAGYGLVQIPMLLVAAELADGRLVEVLQPYRPAALELNLLYAASRWLPRPAEAFLDVARRHFWPERA
jgi:DNA-binding transcriptional LysR family regulator